jgi:hypothetical protein
VDLPERLMTMVSSSSVFVNRLARVQSHATRAEKLRARRGVKMQLQESI